MTDEERLVPKTYTYIYIYSSTKHGNTCSFFDVKTLHTLPPTVMDPPTPPPPPGPRPPGEPLLLPPPPPAPPAPRRPSGCLLALW